jgi:hypothetical protein
MVYFEYKKVKENERGTTFLLKERLIMGSREANLTESYTEADEEFDKELVHA